MSVTAPRHCEAPVFVDPANEMHLPDAGCLGVHLGYRRVEGYGFLCTPHADYAEARNVPKATSTTEIGREA